MRDGYQPQRKERMMPWRNEIIAYWRGRILLFRVDFGVQGWQEKYGRILACKEKLLEQ